MRGEPGRAQYPFQSDEAGLVDRDDASGVGVLLNTGSVVHRPLPSAGETGYGLAVAPLDVGTKSAAE